MTDLSHQKESVQRQMACGIFSAVDATNELQMIEKKGKKLLKQLIQSIHVTQNGTPRKISYKEGKNLWLTIMPDGSKLYASTEDIMYDKLFQAYGLSTTDYSFGGIFNAALDEKSRTENKAKDTINRYNYDYKRFISNSLATKDIRNITSADLKSYTQEIVNTIHPTRKAFTAYKGILNLVFNYAREYEIVLSNPVSTIKNNFYYPSCTTTSSKSEEKILSEAEIQTVKDTVRSYMSQKRYHGYFINGYAILLSIETGMRAGELPSLKWSDIKENYIHIHSQQLYNKQPGGKEYYYANWTKNEKHLSPDQRDGRKFPLTNAIKDILFELKELQTSMGIKSDYVFCHENGEWIKTDAYETCLRRIMKSLGFSVTNNHAFRMSLNSNIFIKKYNLPVTERARLLGHSVETNLIHYSYAGKDNLDDLCAIFNGEKEGLT